LAGEKNSLASGCERLGKSSFLSEKEWEEWRMRSCPVMGEGIQLAVAGAMALVSFVSIF
jgi:hypothetical protein